MFRVPREATAGRGIAAALLVVPVLFGLSTAAQPEPQPQPPATTEPSSPASSPESAPQPEPPSPTPQVPPAAQEATHTDVEIVLTDGRRLTGQLVDRTEELIRVRIAGTVIPLKISDISEIKPQRPVEERHRELRAGIPDDDEERLLNLADWAQSRGRLDLALEDVLQVLKVNPTNPDALQRKTLLEAQIAIDQSKSPRTETPDEQPTRAERARFPLLTDDQINIIRVYEVDLADPPRMLLSKESVKRFIDTYAGQGNVPISKDGREAFARRPASKILEAMFDLQAREFYAEVKVQENPASMRRFRDEVHRWIVSSCATTDCHGGTEAGRFQLYTKRVNSDTSSYTNFYIIDRFRTDDGLALIDFQTPAQSPLLQYALPREDALFKHPELQRDGRNAFRPPFRNENDDRFKATVEWIKSLFQPRPEYPIDYKPQAPFVAPSIRPANPKPR